MPGRLVGSSLAAGGGGQGWWRAGPQRRRRRGGRDGLDDLLQGLFGQADGQPVIFVISALTVSSGKIVAIEQFGQRLDKGNVALVKALVVTSVLESSLMQSSDCRCGAAFSARRLSLLIDRPTDQGNGIRRLAPAFPAPVHPEPLFHMVADQPFEVVVQCLHHGDGIGMGTGRRPRRGKSGRRAGGCRRPARSARHSGSPVRRGRDGFRRLAEKASSVPWPSY